MIVKIVEMWNSEVASGPAKGAKGWVEGDTKLLECRDFVYHQRAFDSIAELDEYVRLSGPHAFMGDRELNKLRKLEKEFPVMLDIITVNFSDGEAFEHRATYAFNTDVYAMNNKGETLEVLARRMDIVTDPVV